MAVMVTIEVVRMRLQACSLNFDSTAVHIKMYYFLTVISSDTLSIYAVDSHMIPTATGMRRDHSKGELHMNIRDGPS